MRGAQGNELEEMEHYSERINGAFRKIKARHFGCAYCGSKLFRTIRIDPIEESKNVYAVNYCPACRNEDWVMINPTDLAILVVVLTSGQ